MMLTISIRIAIPRDSFSYSVKGITSPRGGRLIGCHGHCIIDAGPWQIFLLNDAAPGREIFPDVKGDAYFALASLASHPVVVHFFAAAQLRYVRSQKLMHGCPSHIEIIKECRVPCLWNNT